MINKVLTKVANDKRMSNGLILAGFAFSTISNILMFTGVYYLALHKGVELMEEQYYEQEVKNYGNKNS